MDWSAQQEQAIRAVIDWYWNSDNQVFRLFGYAGTGKTTIAKEIASNIKGLVQFAAFTGKASLVLQTKGCDGACTIHSLIYKVEDEDDGQPTFRWNPDGAASIAKLIIVDEVSMVDEELGRDLLRYGVKVLVLGDPEQLPPVKGTGFFINGEPDFMLTEIHRQAADNPIIRMSMDVREGRGLKLGTYGNSKVITRAQVERNEVLQVDQVLVGLNKTRRTFNHRIRELKGFVGAYPSKGDRVICLKNNKEKNLINGGLWDVDFATEKDKHGLIAMTVDSIDFDISAEVWVPHNFFIGTEGELDWRDRKGVHEFDFGYAITVHKSQGSQWDNLMVFDESRSFRDDARRHLYTAITRAAETITVVV